MRLPRALPLFTMQTIGDTLGNEALLHELECASRVVDDYILDHRSRLEYDSIGAANPRDGAANDRWRMSDEPAFRERERAKMRSDVPRMVDRWKCIMRGGLRLVWIAQAEVNTFDAAS